jgi:DNA-binding CsgD family transcriptional regulator
MGSVRSALSIEVEYNPNLNPSNSRGLEDKQIITERQREVLDLILQNNKISSKEIVERL